MILENENYQRAMTLLAEEGVTIAKGLDVRLQGFLDILVQWNPRYHLVSSDDSTQLIERHVVDSLSLLPILQRCGDSELGHLDIGSGGGFPVIVAAMALPERPFLSVERSVTKYGYLSKLKAACRISNFELACGSFPQVPLRNGYGTITARAVEKPVKILADVCKFMAPGAAFLCQSGYPDLSTPAMFHVERVDDLWKTEGLRRGELHLVRRLT